MPSLDESQVEALTFDSFTTIVDVWSSTIQNLAEYVDDPESIAKLWRFRAVDYRMVSTFTGNYETYTQTTREALEYSLAAHDVELAPEQVDELASVFYDLEVFDDVRPSMERLADLGYELYIVSNGDPNILESMISKANIEDLIDGTVSADEIESYKPESRIYEYTSEKVGTPIEDIAHVATPWYDIYGADNAGMQTVWVNRKDDPWETFDGDPDLTVGSLEEFSLTFASEHPSKTLDEGPTEH